MTIKWNWKVIQKGKIKNNKNMWPITNFTGFMHYLFICEQQILPGKGSSTIHAYKHLDKNKKKTQ